MRAISRLLSTASFALVVIGGLGAAVTMILVTLDVTLRFFGAGIPGTLEFVTYYLMSMVVFLPLARVERLEQAVTVDIFTGALANRMQIVIMLLVSLVSAGVYGVIAYLSTFAALGRFAAGAYVLTDRFPMPIWPAYFVLPVAFGLAALVCLLRAAEIMTGTYTPSGGEQVKDMGREFQNRGPEGAAP